MKTELKADLLKAFCEKLRESNSLHLYLDISRREQIKTDHIKPHVGDDNAEAEQAMRQAEQELIEFITNMFGY